MKIYVTRHGQTDLNKKHLMQGRTDQPLNEQGRIQAAAAAERVKEISFDAVFSSPLDRALETAAIIGHTDRRKIHVDDRIIETDFGPFEKKSYYRMGPAMTLYWALPEIFPAPKGVETTGQMVTRSHAFLKELEKQEYENVLVVCHGGIIRAICGYLEDRKRGYKWRPRPHNCEIRVYECKEGRHRQLFS